MVRKAPCSLIPLASCQATARKPPMQSMHHTTQARHAGPDPQSNPAQPAHPPSTNLRSGLGSMWRRLWPSVFSMLPPPPTDMPLSGAATCLLPLVPAGLTLLADLAASDGAAAAAAGAAAVASVAVGDSAAKEARGANGLASSMERRTDTAANDGCSAAEAAGAGTAFAAAPALGAAAAAAGCSGGLVRPTLLPALDRTSITGTVDAAAATAPGPTTGSSAASEKRPPPKASYTVSPIMGAR